MPDLLLEHRILFVEGVISRAPSRDRWQTDVNEVIAAMLWLEHDSPDKDIHLYINSPGGDAWASLALYDTMQLIRPDVATYAVGFAMSGGSILLVGGAKGKRYATPHSSIMIHQANVQISGQVTDIEHEAAEMRRLQEALDSLYLERTHLGEERISRLKERDLWVSAETAVELGIIDEILTPSEEAAVDRKVAS